MSTNNGGPALQDVRKVIENEDLQSMYRRNDELLSELAEKDARIAELTADLKVADRAALELAAEVEKYRGVAVFVLGICDDKRFEDDEVRHNARNAARNALRDGCDGC